MNTMRKPLRRWLAALLCVMMMFTSISIVPAADAFNPTQVTPEPSPAEYFTVNNNGQITAYTGSETNVVIPAEINGVTVKSINGKAFSFNDSVKAMVIPSTVTAIGGLPDNLESIYFYGKGYRSFWTALGYFSSYSLTIYCKAANESDFEDTMDYEGEYFTVEATIAADLADPAYPAAESHNYVYTDNGDGTHTVTCSDEGCTYREVENHTYTLGVCVCGAKVDGSDPSFFNYELRDGKAWIIGYNSNGLGGEITLPSTYTVDGTTYEVVGVAEYAFSGNNTKGTNDFEALSKITKITVPASITTVEKCGFNYVGRYQTSVWNLTKIVFEAENVTFGAAALGGNPKLTSVTLPSKQTELGSSMFSSDTALTELTVPSTITKVGELAFMGCTALTKVTFMGTVAPEMPVSANSYPTGKYPFAGLNQAITLSVPAASLEAYNTAWSDMLAADLDKKGNITVSTWGESEPVVASIPDFKVYVNGTTADSDYPKYMEYHVVSFDNATKSGKVELKYVGWNKEGGTLDIPETVTTQVLGKDWTFTVVGIGKNAMFSHEMSGASSDYWFTTVNFPSTLEYIAKGGCWSLKKVTEIDLSNTKVTSIGSYAFYGCQMATVVKLPDTLASMGGDETSTVKRDDDLGTTLTYTENVFACCDALEKILVNASNPYFKSVDGILYSKDGTKLIRYPTARPDTHFDIPEGVEVIASQAFMQSFRTPGALTTVSFPSTLKEIESLAFRQSNLTEVTLPVGVKFGSSIFDISKKLAKVTIPEGVTEIGEYMFWSCEALTELKCPASLQKIGANAFGHTGLTSIDLAKVAEIGDYAFYYCPLTRVTIPATANTLGKGIFAGCTDLTTANFTNGCTTVGAYMFASDYKLVNLNLPDSIQTIGDGAFEYCSKLEELTMPASLSEMGEGVFYKAWRLRSVIFPDSVTITMLPAYTFESCQALTYLHLGKNIKATGAVSLYDTNSGLIINCAVEENEFVRNKFDVFPYDLDNTSIVWEYEESGRYQDGYPVYNVWMYDNLGNKLTESIPVNAGATPTFKYGVTQQEDPIVLTVYEKTGNTSTVKATYTEKQLKALMDENAPAAGYQFWKQDVNYTDPVPNLVVATGYVTIETLLDNAGIEANSYDKLSAADRSDYSSVVSFADLKAKNRYFDGTNGNGNEVPAAIAIKWNSAKNDAFTTLFETAKSTAYESGNLRFCYGISQDEIGTAAGKRLASNVVSLTVIHRLLGDINGDGIIDICDAGLLVQYCNDLIKLTPDQQALADLNGDGEIDIMDAGLLVQYCNDIITAFPVNAA